MKKFVLSVLILSASLCLLLGCSQTNKATKKTSETTTSVEKTSSSTKSSSTEAASDEALTDESTQQIGNDEVGYVNVPSNWVKFQDLSGGGSYQYSAPDAYTIVTMFGYSKETLGMDAINDEAAKKAASSYVYGMKQSGQYGEVTGAKAKIAGYEAYQVYAKAKSDGKLICAWVFVTEEKNKVYLISLEGKQADKVFLKELAFIEKAWTSKK